ncbi:hypothetical protein [Bacillus glycinifermentans]|uniref:Uncharacterized protein n=1 Tax=Bacillus glycinifermentans TaxID=1664069 RepID=A0A0T6BUQ4_9BACI|nr:hypothetical protein [Bacillus glycinifermentans]ATH92601.1 hypothetical protein COP00_08205 [Bacillus glycinifermentans]KRT95347.1 hypothetical protein AB447_212715 [Bacillus glycinifermentans]MEC0486920.1 hypothetical protein [Bacillus glycinifermentans]MEC3605768.1 hypothetical protein [Bacillus glycinifermentans]UOY90134.1 hypothetical protein MW696_07990 [Bacillus glycinifermentans]
MRRWSKDKQQLEGLMCESLKQRVNFHVTAYRKAHDQMGRAFITVDGKDIFSMCTLTAINKAAEIESRSERVRNVDDVTENVRIYDEALHQANADGYFYQYQFFDALDEYFTNSIDQTLSSEQVLVRMLGMIDRRTGRRRLLNLEPVIDREHEIVKYFYKLRMEAERKTARLPG